MSGASRTDLPLRPVSIALETIKLEKRSDNLKLSGIDLDSGRRVKIRIEFFDHGPARVDPISDLLLVMTMQRLTS